MAAIMAVSVFPMTAFASSSVGSTSADTTVGEDTAQGAKTQYSEVGMSDTQTKVYLTVEDKDLIASLPTTIIVSGTPTTEGKYVGEYSVGVSGNMSGDKVVTIEPESANVTLKQKGKNDKSASISQEQTEFSTDDFKNKTRTNGAVTADSLTAGSWNGTFNFNISYQQVQYSYYSSIELAANDANNMTTANADVSEDNFDDAVAALLVKDNKASIKMLKDESNVDNVTLSQDTSINLGTHTVTFAEGKYLTANNNLLIDNGKISTTNSEYAVYTNSQDSSFTMNNVTIKEELSSEIPTAYMVTSFAQNKQFDKCNFEMTGTGSDKTEAVVLYINSKDRENNSTDVINNCKLSQQVAKLRKDNAKNEDGTTAYHNDMIVLRKSTSTINDIYINQQINTGTRICGINLLSNSNLVLNGADIYVSATVSVTGSGIFAGGNAGKLEINSTDEHPVTVYGKQWGIETASSTDTAVINGGVYTSTNHTAYFETSVNATNCTFNIANRDKYDASNLDTAYGFYCGGSNGTAESTINAVQNFNKCVINNGDTRSQSGICLQRNYKYNAPKEVNLTDCELYSGWRGIYFNSLSGKDYPSVTKVNLYGNTKLYDSKGVLITKQQLADAIAVWKTKEQGSHKTYPCASTTGLRTTANTCVIVGEGWATEKGVVNAYATEDCGVYDYR
jgi:hypothetical protein